MIIKRIFDKLFSAHKRKQNQKLANAVSAAEAHTNRSAKMADRISHYQAELEKSGGDISKLSKRGQDFVKSHEADFAKGVKPNVAPTVQKQAAAATQAAGRAGEVAGKMTKTRKSLAEGKELTVQAGGQKKGLKVKVEKKKSLADQIKAKSKGKKGPGPQTTVTVKSEKTAQQGGAKAKIETALGEGQAQKLEAKGADKIKSKIAPTAQPTTTQTITPNKANTVKAGASGKSQVNGMKILKGGAGRLGKWGKPLAIGAGAAVVAGTGIAAGKAYNEKKKIKNFSEKKSFAQEVAEDASLAGSLGAAGGLGYAGYQAGKGLIHSAKGKGSKVLSKETLAAAKRNMASKATQERVAELTGSKVEKIANKAKSIKAFRNAGRGSKIAAGAAAASIVAGATAKGLGAIRNKKESQK